jgi:hypothetical protein
MHTPHRLTFYGKKSQLPAMLAAGIGPFFESQHLVARLMYPPADGQMAG